MGNLTKQQELVIDYLMDNYYDDAERMANIRMVGEVIASVGKPEQIASTIDRVALFNGIKKSYPPKRTIKQNIIRGIGFIMYGG